MTVGESGQYGIGDTIGQYRIVAELGRGGMGVVYKAHDESLDRYVAIKVLGEHLAEDSSYVERFVREARSAARLSHPNIVQIHLIGEDRGRHFFAMEYVEGSSLQEVLRRSGPIDPGEAAGLVLQIAAGLAVAHDRDVVHRDIKPANLLIDSRGLVKIADFGLALMPSSASRLTATGMFMGTPGYLAPEQCLDESVGPGTDIYSLGVSYFEMLTGEMPFKAESPFALIRKIVEVEPPDVRDLKPGIDSRTRAVLARMMAKDPAHRYASCHQLIRDLQGLPEGSPSAVGLGPTAVIPAGTRCPAPGPAEPAADDASPTLEVDSGSGPASAPPPPGRTPPPLPVADRMSWADASSGRATAPAGRRPLLIAATAAAGLALVLVVGGALALWSIKGRREQPEPRAATVSPMAEVPGPGARAPVGLAVSGAIEPPLAVSRVESGGGEGDGEAPGPIERSENERVAAVPAHPATEEAREGETGAGAPPETLVPTVVPTSAAPTKPPPPTAQPAVLSPREREIRRLADQLRSRDPGTQRNAARAVYRSYPHETGLLEVVNDELLRGFDRNSEEKYHVDAMAWMCNVLGVSGETRYRGTLERIARSASNRKIRRYAAKNLERLR